MKPTQYSLCAWSKIRCGSLGAFDSRAEVVRRASSNWLRAVFRSPRFSTSFAHGLQQLGALLQRGVGHVAEVLALVVGAGALVQLAEQFEIADAAHAVAQVGDHVAHHRLGLVPLALGGCARSAPRPSPARPRRPCRPAPPRRGRITWRMRRWASRWIRSSSCTPASGPTSFRSAIRPTPTRGRKSAANGCVALPWDRRFRAAWKAVSGSPAIRAVRIAPSPRRWRNSSISRPTHFDWAELGEQATIR